MLVNVVDVPPLCNFILPAIVRSGPLAIAISTAGASPALAKRMKREIAEEFGEPYARLAVILNDHRGWAKATLPTYQDRKEFFEDRQRPPRPGRSCARGPRARAAGADRGRQGALGGGARRLGLSAAQALLDVAGAQQRRPGGEQRGDPGSHHRECRAKARKSTSGSPTSSGLRPWIAEEGAGRAEALDLGRERPQGRVDDEGDDQDADDRDRLVAYHRSHPDAEGAEQGGDAGVSPICPISSPSSG